MTKGEIFWKGAPDLAVEVTLPSDSFSDVEAKVIDWLKAGLPFIVQKKSITILNKEDEIDGQDVVPGWKVKVADLFT